MPGIDKGNHDGFAKNRWSARNCHRDIFPPIGGEIIRSSARRWSESPFQFACPHGQEWIVWRMQCGLPLIQILEQLCCLLMALEHTTTLLRSAMLGKLLEEENLRGLLPFVRMVYSQPSRHHWEDEDGCRKEICQHEGGEQGDPLMPLLFCLAIHNVLVEVRSQLLPGEHLFAFLDDIYALTKPERTRHVYDLLAHNLFQYAGIRLHAGKTRTWNRAGEIPERTEEFGEDVWSPVGVKILGTPVGSLDLLDRGAIGRKNRNCGGQSPVSQICNAHGSCCFNAPGRGATIS